jgi:hypothetical protein
MIGDRHDEIAACDRNGGSRATGGRRRAVPSEAQGCDKGDAEHLFAVTEVGGRVDTYRRARLSVDPRASAMALWRTMTSC